MKTVTRILAVLLAVFFCCSALAILGSAAGTAGEAAKGGSFLFGYYPQTEVTDKATLAMLEKQPNNKPVTTENATYVALKMINELVPGDVTLSAAYGYDINETYWFECKPIEWRVLDKTDAGVLLMAEQVIETRAFNTPITSDNTWANSTVRAWLNDTFYNTAFSKAEQSYIIKSSNANTVKNLIIKGNCGADTQDYVFLPSFNDITNAAYGFSDTCEGVAYGDYGNPIGYYELDPARKAKPTEYAMCRGVWANTDASDMYPITEYCRYWLRTAGADTSAAERHDYYTAGVLEDGRVSVGWMANQNNLGIRPMILVSPDAVYSREEKAPDAIEITMPDETVRYRQTNVRPIANQDVIWSTSDPSIATIDADGNLTITGVGTVTITATLKSDPSVSTSKELTVKYAWWQQLIRIFLFGWIWY